jgi:hypothetical protein
VARPAWACASQELGRGSSAAATHREP